MRLSLLFTSDNKVYEGIEKFGVPRCTEPYGAYNLALIQNKGITDVWYVGQDILNAIIELRRFYLEQFQMENIEIFITDLPIKSDF